MAAGVETCRHGCDHLAEYAAYQTRRQLAPNSVKGIGQYLRGLAAEVGCLLQADPDALDAAIPATVSRSTRYWRLSVVSGFYRWAIRSELVERDPTVLIDRPKLPRRLPRPIGDADLGMAVAMADDRLRVILLLAAGAGLRCCEIAWLTADRVLDDPPRLLVTGKGSHERIVPLAAHVRAALDAYGLPPHGAVVRRHDHRQSTSANLSPDTVSAVGNAHLRSLGIRSTMHALRHWHATKVLEASGDITLVQKLLGHADIGTTQGYARVVLGRRATEVVEGLPLPTGA